MKTFTHPADYDYEIINNTLVIYDLDQGNASVTNDISYVLETIQKDVHDLANKKIIYQDSEKTFDGIKVNGQGQFAGFYSINERKLENALAKA